MPIPVYPEYIVIEVDLGSGWVELEDVQIVPPLSVHRGIQGTSQRDRVASTGAFTFTLDNSEGNSQGKLGLYSLNHVNRLPGWDLGIPVRASVAYMSVEEPIFVGTISSIEPTSGRWGKRKVAVSCVDWMEECAQSKVSGIPIQLNKRSDEVFATILAAMKKQPTATQIGIGGDVYPYALDNAFGEEISVMAEFQRIAQSELAYIFVTRSGTLTYQGRHRRPNLFNLSETLTDADIRGLDTSRGREEIINSVQVQVHPRRIDDDNNSVLFSLASTPKLAQRTEQTFNALYRDPTARATRVGGLDMQDPVEFTDYEFNTEEDGSGTDITAQITVSATFGGNSADIVVYNKGPYDGYLTKLQCRGRGVYAYETVIAASESVPSQDQYGLNTFSLDMPYQTDFNVATDAAGFIVAQNKSLLTQVRAVTFIANRESRLLRSALTVDIGHRVRVEEEVIGTAGTIPIGETLPISALEFFVNAVELSIGEHGIITCTWTLTPADAFNYWILERDGFTELDVTTRLGYGSRIAGWVVEESELGITTRVNY